MRIVVLGAGGHGKVVADCLLAAGHAVAGFLDDGRAPGQVVLAGLEVLGPTEWLRSEPCQVALGIGDNASRARLAQRCLELGSRLFTAVHPRAVIAPSAALGEGVVVMACAVINPSATVATGAIVNTGAVVEHDCVIGAFAHVSPNATLGGECRLGDGAHLGIGATMLPRTSVGARTVVGGGALVNRDIRDDVIAIGVPARERRARS